MTFAFRSLLLPVVLASTTLAVAQNKALSTRPVVRVTAKIDRNNPIVLPGTHPSVVARATIGGRLAAATQLQHMILVLNASDEQNAALISLMDAQQDKTSPSYHKWLTPDTFSASFGVASPDIAQVSAWLADSGLSVESVSRSGRFISFSGPVSAVESAFSTELHNLTVNGEAHIANTTDISVPAALAPVVKGIARLNNFFPKSPSKNWKQVSLQKNAPNSVEIDQPQYGSTSTGTHYVGAGDMANIFNAKPLTSNGIDGTGVTISVLARSNITIADVETYRSLFGLPKNDPNIIVVGADPGENQDDIEAFLDAEMAGALATGATVDFIVSAPTLVGGDIDAAGLYAVDNNVGDIITLSYGGCESGNGASGTAFWNILWEEAAAQGQSAFVSSGDSGAAGCDSSGASFSTGGYGVNALGSSNYNVSVGGSIFVDFGPAQYWAAGITTPPYATALGYIPEAALNQSRLTTTELNSTSTAFVTGSGIFAGGGGISIYTPRASWQTGSGISATSDPAAVSGTGIATGSTITGPHRLVPDVAFISANGHDGTLFCAEGICAESATGTLANAGIVGGTSVAAPAMASVQALIDAANGGRQGNPNYYYYPLANQQYTASTTACQAVNGTPANPTVTLPASTCNFHDIVTGSITVPTAASGTAGIGFNAVTGYDAATGLGSVNIANLATNWKSVSFPSTTTTLSLTPQTTTHGSTQIASMQVTAGSGTPTGDVSIIASSYPSTGTPQVYTLTGGAVNGIVNSLPGGTYNVHAHYGGDGTFAASDSAPVPVTISKEASTIFLQPYLITAAGSVNTITSTTYGAGEVYLDSQVTPASGNGTPSGSVTYTITQNGVTLPGATAKLDTFGNAYLSSGPPFSNFYLSTNYPTFTPGSYTVTANYSGDASLTSTAGTASFTITQATPVVSYTTSTAMGTPNSTTDLNFITTTPASAAPASGTVTFTDTTTSTMLGIVNLVNGKALLLTNSLSTIGNHNITATYSGDTNYTGATYPAVTVNVSQAYPSGTTLTPSTTTPAVATAVTLNATVFPIPTTATLVSFYDNLNLLGTASTSVTTGTASFRVTAGFSAGAHFLTAVYSGDATHATSTGVYNLTTAKATTTMAIGGPQNSPYGQVVVFNGAITRSPTSTAPAYPLTGMVSFYDGSTSGTLLGSAAPVLGAPGGYGLYTATLSISGLTAGTHSIVASYPGDANYGPSTSIAAPLTINKIAAVVSYTTSTAMGTPNSTTDLNFIATPSASTAPASGTVTFTDNYISNSTGYPVVTTLGMANLVNGKGLLLTNSLKDTGTHSITATYTGDNNYTAATYPAVIVNVSNAYPSGVVLFPSTYTPAVGTPVTLSAFVFPTPSAPTLVYFYDNLGLIGTALTSTVPSGTGTSGLATFTVTNGFTAGSHSLNSVYSGDATHASSTGSASLTAN